MVSLVDSNNGSDDAIDEAMSMIVLMHVNQWRQQKLITLLRDGK